MDPEDYPSDSDVSDEDFRPDKADSESESDVESEGNIDENAADNEDGDETTSGGKKRKRKIKKVGKKKTKLDSKHVDEAEKNDVAQQDEPLNDEDEERKTDALWADFLAGTGSSSNSSNTLSKEPAKKDLPKTPVSAGVEKTTTVKKIFEFAGEAVEVTEVVPASKAEESSKPSKPALTTVSSNTNVGLPRPLVGRSSGGGLGAVLGQIGKKNKLSTLEKTKLDWNSFKRNEGIEEELQTHNKGKDGFLERQDFLQRADLRQFEIEKSFRQSRSKR